MWNNSYRTPTEHWQKTSDFPKGKKLPKYLGRAKEKRKNTDKRIRTRSAPLGGSSEGGKVSTLGSPFAGGDCGWQVRGGGVLEPRRRAQKQGCRGQSGEIPAQRISGDQYSPAWEDCLPIPWDRWGLGAEVLASEVRSQGEDWGWLREHSLKGASAPQLPGRESGQNSGTD